MVKKVSKKFYFIFIIMFVFSYLSFDFYNFYNNNFLSQNKIKISPNMVVLTGGSNRIKQTLNLFLLNHNGNHNLLISGAGTGFSKKTILKLIKKTPENLKILNCCITVENQSTDTYSNAIESYKWIKKNNFKSITLITSDYHMPRALIEFKQKLNDIRITPLSLKSELSNPVSNFKVNLFEYLKFKATKLRINFFKII